MLTVAGSGDGANGLHEIGIVRLIRFACIIICAIFDFQVILASLVRCTMISMLRESHLDC